MARMVVVLPAPFGPEEADHLTGGTSKERSSRAITDP